MNKDIYIPGRLGTLTRPEVKTTKREANPVQAGIKHPFYPVKSFLNAPSFRSLFVDSVRARNLRIPVDAAPLPNAAALATSSSFRGMIPGVDGLAVMTGVIPEGLDAAGTTAAIDGW